MLLLSHTLGGSTDRVVLAGVAAMQLFSALTSFVVMTAADAEQTRGVLFWLLGSLSGVGWTDVWMCSAVLAVTLLICLGHARTLDAFAFGQDAAAALGVHVGRTRIVLLCTTALLTAALVSTAGAIGFVGLVQFAIAIGAFVTSEVVFIKQLGLGTAIAVLIDATIIRALLVPSLMQLLGRWNWWAPRPLRRLHARIGLSEA